MENNLQDYYEVNKIKTDLHVDKEITEIVKDRPAVLPSVCKESMEACRSFLKLSVNQAALFVIRIGYYGTFSVLLETPEGAELSVSFKEYGTVCYSYLRRVSPVEEISISGKQKFTARSAELPKPIRQLLKIIESGSRNINFL